MARTAPVPNMVAIPGMNPGIFVLGGGGDGGGSGAGNGKGKGGKQGAGGKNGGKDANGGGPNAGACGAGSGAGCPNPAHGGGGGTAAGDPVDVAGGRVFTAPQLDLVLPGPLLLLVHRSYSSAATDRDVGLGRGWSCSLSWEIEVRRRTLVLHRPNGARLTLPIPGVGEPVQVGQGAVLQRDESGYTVIDADGRVHLFQPSAGEPGLWRLSGIADLSGNRVSLHYRDDALDLIVDSAGRFVHVRRAPDGHIAAFDVDGGGGRCARHRTYEYDGEGDLVIVRDGAGSPLRFTYDEHRLTRMEYASGLTVHHVYDGQGRCVETWCDHGGAPDPALADDAPRTLADGVTPAKGFLHAKLEFGDDFTQVVTSLQVRRYETNALGTVDKATNGGGVTTLDYDGAGHVLAHTDPAGAVTTYRRDARGRLTEVIDPGGARTSFAYNGRGNLTEVVDALGHFARYRYDELSRLVETVDDLGSVVQFAYDHRGQRVRATMPNGAETRFRYDAHGNLVELVEPHGAPRRMHYDEFGRVLGYQDERGARTEFSYDARGQLVAVRMPNGGTQRIDHDDDGRPTRVRGADGGAFELSWGGYNVVHELRRPTGEVVRFRYDRECNLVQVINERGEVHRMIRDAAGRIVEERLFDGRIRRYTHDAAGNLLVIEGEGGERTELVRDACGRVVKRVHSDDTADVFEYDALGQLVAAENEQVRCEHAYDARGRMVRETTTFGGRTYSVESEHDAAGKRAAIRTSLGSVVRFERDAMGLPRKAHLGDGATIEFRWDVMDSELERRLPGEGLVRSTYDVMGFLSERSVRAAGAPAVGADEPSWVGRLPPGTTFAAAYASSPGGDLLEEHIAGLGKTLFAYDPAGRILSRTPAKGPPEAYRYEAGAGPHEAGPGAPARTYGPGGRLLARGDTLYRYDQEARLVEKRPSRGDDPGVRYEWSARGLLAAVVLPDGTRVENIYDPYARRVAKRVVSPGGRVTTTRFVWDRDVLVHEIREPEAPAGDTAVSYRTYVHRGEAPLPLAHRDTRITADGRRESGWVHYLLGPGERPDLLVSDAGEVLGDLSATVWGMARSGAPAQAETPLRYPGQYLDAETGLSYNRYRFYDAEIGRYISADPIGLAGGLDPFAYAHDQPFRFHDPLGLAPPVTTTVSGTAGTEVRNSGGNPGALHPVIEAALPPRAPDNNGIYPGYRDGIPPGQSPTACGEPRALSDYIRTWEAQHRRNPDGSVRQLDPNNPDDHADIQRCLGSISNISSTQPRSDGTTGARAPCPNCSQLLANLHQQYGQPNPSVIQPGATSRDGTDSTNFSTPNQDWVRQQQQAIANGGGRSGPQPAVPHVRGPDGPVPSPVPEPTGPAYPPHSGYGTTY